MKTVLYTGSFQFPDKDAAAKRVLGVSQLFKCMNYEVSFAGWEAKPQGQAFYIFNGHRCYPQSEFAQRKGILSKILKSFTLGMRTFRWIVKRPIFDIVVLYNPPALFAFLMLIWCKIKKIPLILDCTEWHESKHIMGWSGGPYSLKSYLAIFENFLRMRFVYRKFFNVIAISTYLERYYKLNGNVIRLPPIMFSASRLVGDLDSILDINSPEGVYFIYAGSAGRKDNIVDFVASLPEISKFISRTVKVLIVGMSQQEVDELLRESGLIPEIFHPFYIAFGWLPHDQVNAIYKRAHFSILFRDDKRYARAGFPTKLMESWFNGRPVFANEVGDICLFGERGVDIVSVSRASLALDIGSALKLIIANNSYNSMALHCRSQAEYHFSIDTYISQFKDFVSRLRA